MCTLRQKAHVAELIAFVEQTAATDMPTDGVSLQVTGTPSQLLFVTSPPFGTPYPVAPPPTAPGTRACSRCGGGLAPAWRVCPYCGQAATGNVPPATPSS